MWFSFFQNKTTPLIFYDLNEGGKLELLKKIPDFLEKTLVFLCGLWMEIF